MPLLGKQSFTPHHRHTHNPQYQVSTLSCRRYLGGGNLPLYVVSMTFGPSPASDRQSISSPDIQKVTEMAPQIHAL